MSQSLNNSLSLYIPRVVDQWANEEKIAAVFHTLNIGSVSRIDFVEKQSENGRVYYQAFVYFSEWYDTPSARGLQERITAHAEDGEKPAARIVYNDPWFWLLLVNAHPISEKERDLQRRLHVVETYAGNTQLQVNVAFQQLQGLQQTTNFLMQNAGFGVPAPLVRQVNTPQGPSQTHLPTGLWGPAANGEFGNAAPVPQNGFWDKVLPENLWGPTARGVFGNPLPTPGWEPEQLSAEQQQDLARKIWKESQTEDEDEGLSPFHHAPEPLDEKPVYTYSGVATYSPNVAQRARAGTEEEELEARRRQKPSVNQHIRFADQGQEVEGYFVGADGCVSDWNEENRSWVRRSDEPERDWLTGCDPL